MNEILNGRTVLITGGDGYAGSNLYKFFLDRGFSVYRSVVHPKGLENEVILDITDEESVRRAIESVKPDSIIHTAGLSSLAECEKDPEKAELINFTGTKNIVDQIDEKTKLIFFSSDYVFDGEKGDYKENDLAAPWTVYGKTKLRAEQYIAEKLTNYIVVRTANIFGRGGNFFSFVLESSKNSESIEAYDDVLFTPTQIDFLIFAIYRLTQIDFRGIIHIAGKDKVTRYEFATKIASEFDDINRTIVKTKQPENGLIARDSSLNCDLLGQTIDLYSPSISESIRAALNFQDLPYFKFSDDRGKIIGISQGIAWKEINFFESDKGCVRGNHYHKETVEGFYVIDGEIEVCLEDQKSGEKKNFTARKGDIFRINPYIVHAFTVKTDSKWINLLSKEMVSMEKDIYKYKA